jgi:hypothetical protein
MKKRQKYFLNLKLGFIFNYLIFLNFKYFLDDPRGEYSSGARDLINSNLTQI